MKTFALIAATGSLAAMTAPAAAADFAPATGVSSYNSVQTTVAFGGDRYDDRRYRSGRYDDDRRYRDRRDRRDRHYRDRGVYDDRGRYYEPRRIRNGDRIWRGRDGQYYCERGNGTTGLVIGAGVGALLGRTIDTRGDRTVGTLLGGALGAVLGRELDRGSLSCR